MSVVVTGLSQNGDLSTLRAALVDAGLSTGPLQVLNPDDSQANLSRGIAGSGLLTRDVGTGVPGINDSQSARNFFRDESLSDRLQDLRIPETEVDNYVQALERGRSLVTYSAPAETTDRIEEVFRSANLVNVRRFT